MIYNLSYTVLPIAEIHPSLPVKAGDQARTTDKV